MDRRCRFVVALGCSSARYGAETGPTLTLPAHFAEGNTGKRAHDAGAPDAAPAAGGQAAADAATPSRAGSDPDPEPLRTASQWEYRFEYVKGKVRIVGVRRLELDRPVATARRFGRFAVELRVGSELVDRVRFDFPLLAADTPASGPRHPLHEPPQFSPGAETSQRVQVPDSDRATSAVLVDRSTHETVTLPWPPTPSETTPLPAGSAKARP